MLAPGRDEVDIIHIIGQDHQQNANTSNLVAGFQAPHVSIFSPGRRELDNSSQIIDY